MRVLIILILATTISCSPQKRLNRLLKNHPELLTSKKDTIYIESVESDTAFYYLQKDTVVIKEGKLTMKYFYNNTDSTVFIQGKCDADTVIREVQIPKFIEYKRKWYDKAARPLAILCLIFIFIIFAYLIKKILP